MTSSCASHSSPISRTVLLVGATIPPWFFFESRFVCACRASVRLCAASAFSYVREKYTAETSPYPVHMIAPWENAEQVQRSRPAPIPPDTAPILRLPDHRVALKRPGRT